MGEGLRHVRPVDNEVSSQGEDGGEEKGSGRSVRPQSAPDEGADGVEAPLAASVLHLV